jgi:hypothetical protein
MSYSGRELTTRTRPFLPPRRKQTRSGASIALVGCVPEVMDFKELVLWCAEKIDTERRIIQVRGKKTISLVPSVFKRMLQILKPTMQFKSEEVIEFIKEHIGGGELLEKYLDDPRTNTNVVKIEVSSLKYPYKEFTWLFACIIRLESTASMPKNVVYILHFVVHEDALIDWGHLISNEISFQLGGLKRTQKFYMTFI